MTGTTSKGWPYVTPTDHPLEYPAFSQQFAQFADATVKIGHALKSADQTGIASGGPSGLTATLTGVRVGQLVLGLITAAYKPTTGAVPGIVFINPDPVGLTAIGANAPVPQNGYTNLNGVWSASAVLPFTASAATVSLGYRMTFSQNSTWTCLSQSNVVLIAL